MRIVLAMLATLLAVVAIPAAAAPTAGKHPVLLLNTTSAEPYVTDAHDGFLDLVLAEVGRRMGVEFRILRLPAERALISANEGVIDGEVNRLAAIEKQYPNLLRVPEAIRVSHFSAFARDKSIRPTAEEIRKRPVGLVKGFKIFEKVVEGAPHVTTTDDGEQLLRLLSLGRIDIALFNKTDGAIVAKKLGLKNIIALEPPLLSADSFPFLHKRHAELVPKFAAALKAVKAEGLYDRWLKEKVLSQTVGSGK